MGAEVSVLAIAGGAGSRLGTQLRNQNHGVRSANGMNEVQSVAFTDLPPLLALVDDDCAAVFKLLLNTYGAPSTRSTHNGSRDGAASVDFPLLLCRSIDPCLHSSLCTLSKLCV